MNQPIFHLFAGPNGAGKSTLYRAFLASGVISDELEFVNADLYERDNLQHITNLQKRSEAARVWADGRRSTLLKSKVGFASETVFSHASKLELIGEAQSLGYRVVLYVVSVEDPKQLLARVSQRVQEGGHNVPAQRILERYPRTMSNLKKAVRSADLSFVYDAVEAEHGAHVLTAVCEKQQTTVLVENPPRWVNKLLGKK